LRKDLKVPMCDLVEKLSVVSNFESVRFQSTVIKSKKKRELSVMIIIVCLKKELLVVKKLLLLLKGFRKYIEMMI
jgi:hypothetical protein